MARSRGPAPAAQSAEERTKDMFAGYKPDEKPTGEKSPVPEKDRLPIEGDLSAMHIALKSAGYSPGLVWLSGMPALARHMVAVWLADPEATPPPKSLLPYKIVEKPESYLDGDTALKPEAPAPAKVAGASPRHATTLEPDLVSRGAKNSISNATSVRVTWGSDRYGLKGEYSSFETPSFEVEVALGDQQDPVAVAEEVLAKLEALAEKMHQKKLAFFLAKLGVTRAEAAK